MSTTAQAGPASFKILSLDGGGLRGVFTAAVLAGLEEQSRCRLADHFDLIAGTSTGGIIALGIACGVPARDILGFYESEGPMVFPARSGWAGLRARVKCAWSPKHVQTSLRAALEEVFGTRTLHDLRTRVLVPAFNAAVGDVRVFKTRHAKRVLQDHTRRIVDVALATSAAPLYLPAFHTPEGERLIDGGLWANNPVVPALLEAIAVLQQPRDVLKVLSVGTPVAPFHLDPSTGRGGWWQWLRAAWNGPGDLLLAPQMAAAHAQALLLLERDEQRYLRIAPPVRQNRFALDRPGDISDLKALAQEQVRHQCARVHEMFLTEPARHPFVSNRAEV